MTSISRPPREVQRLYFSGVGPYFVVSVLLALFSAIVVLTSMGTNVPDVSAANTLRLWPYILVLALVLCGFGWFAGLLALVGGIGMAAVLAPAVLLTLMDPAVAGIFLFAVLAHGCAAVTGGVQLTQFKTEVANPPARLGIGGGAALAVWGAAWWLMSARHAHVRNMAAAKREQVAATAALAQRTEATRWAETDNLRLLADVGFCLEHARGVAGTSPYPHTLAAWRQLAGSSDEPRCRSLITAPESLGGAFVAALSPHVTVRYVPPAFGRADPSRPRGYALELTAHWSPSEVQPLLQALGTRSYRIDTSGAVHLTSDHRPATDADSVVPVCHGMGSPCIPFLPRQRWGMTPDMPTGLLLGHVQAFVGVKAPVELQFTPTSRLDSVRTIDVEWGEHDEHTRVDVPAPRSYAPPHRSLSLALPHVFADTGRHVVRAVVTTSDGSAYRFADTIAVRVRPREAAALGIDPLGAVVAGGIPAQVRRAVANVRAALAKQGLVLGGRVNCVLYLRDMKDADAATDAFFDAFPSGEAPGSIADKNPDPMPRGALVRLECREL